MKIIIILILVGCLKISPILSHAAEGFTNHGIAAPVARSFGAILVENKNGERLLLSWIGDHSSGSTTKLIINADTGDYSQIDVNIQGWDTAKGTLLSSKNRWYVNFGHRFFEFCPDLKKFTFIGETDDRSAYSLTEDPEGVIWGVQRHNGTVISFNPETKELKDHGSGQVESWSQYARTIAADNDGWIYAGIGAVATQVVSFNSITGEHRQLIAENLRTRGSARVIRGKDGSIYADAPDWGWHKLRGGKAFPVEGKVPLEAEEGLRYQAGRHFFIDNFQDGSSVKDFNVPGRKVEFLDPQGETWAINFDYKTPGARVYSLLLSPDGKIYGGTGHPTHIFKLNPSSGQMKDWHMYEGSHYNDLVWHNDFIYAAIYLGGGIDRYNPEEKWNPGVNPKRIMEDAGPELVRPSVLMMHPNQRHLIMAGSPRRGLTAAGLAIFDIEKNERLTIANENLLKNQNTVALLALEDGNLLGATTTRPGTGGERRASEAELYLFDWNTKTILWHEALLENNDGFVDIIFGPDEKLIFGITEDSRFFVFDLNTRKIIHEISLSSYGRPSGSQAARIMQLAKDGMIYVLFREGILSVDPESFQHRLLASSPVDIRVGIEIIEDRIFFATQSEIWSFKIPE